MPTGEQCPEVRGMRTREWGQWHPLLCLPPHASPASLTHLSVPHPPPSPITLCPRPSTTAHVPYLPQHPSPSARIPHPPPVSLTHRPSPSPSARGPHPLPVTVTLRPRPSPSPTSFTLRLRPSSTTCILSSRSQKACLGHRQNPNYREVCKLLLAESLLLH